MNASLAALLDTARNLIHQKSGPLTRELVQTPGAFGLGNLPDSVQPDQTNSLVCGFCSTGCSLNVHLKDGKAIGLTPSRNSNVNLGMACPKGWEALSVLEADDRATSPLLRKDGKLQPVSWDSALREFCQRFQNIQQIHGSESVAFLSTGQIVCEEMALLGAVAKFGIHFNPKDRPARTGTRFQ